MHPDAARFDDPQASFQALQRDGLEQLRRQSFQ
jgi:hypothetical protein